MIKRVVFYLLIFTLIAVGCRDSNPTPTATLAVPPSPTAESVSANGTVAPTSTLPPTSTIVAIASTFTPIPTSTKPAEPTMTPTIEVEPVRLLTPEDFGDDRNRLTGELVADPSVLLRRPIAVKISNSPPNYVRPQSGLGQADIVFEHVTEGPITRFTAIIYSQTPEKMGPIRSARPRKKWARSAAPD